MPGKNDNNIHARGRTAFDDKPLLNLILFSSSDHTYHDFRVPSAMTVSAFLERALAKLSDGDGAERVEALKRYYQPVLELQHPEGGTELHPQSTLAKAGVNDWSVLRIVARPLKEKIMFCRYG